MIEKKFFDTSSLLEMTEEQMRKNAPIVISSISLYELEHIKTSAHKSEELKTQARKLTHFIYENPNLFIIWIFNELMMEPIINKHLPENDDMRILATAINYENSECPDEMIFFTNDLSLANIANLFFGEDSINRINNVPTEENYYGYKIVDFSDEELADFYSTGDENTFDLYDNEYLLIKSRGEIVDAYCWTGLEYRALSYGNCNSKWFGSIKPFKDDIYQRLALDSLYHHNMTMICGKAGSGKSFLSLGFLFSQLDKGEIDRIVVFCNPVVAKDAAKLGFYPGTVEEKLLSSQVGGILASKIGSMLEVERLISEEKLVLVPAGDARGYEVPANSGVYIMESQNLTKGLMRLFLQRVGEDCKIIIDGDYFEQVDMEAYADENNGMRAASKVFRGSELFGQVELQNIHRSKIAALADKIR